MHSADKPQTDAAFWDGTYTSPQDGKWSGDDREINDRAAVALSLCGPLAGKSLLDLGGGPLLGRHTVSARRHTVVDISPVVCALARRLAPHVETVAADALEFLASNTDRYDVTVCMGLLEYLPGGALDTLFRLAPSPVLVLTACISRGYLLYPGRITVYGRDDVRAACALHGWTEKSSADMSNERVFSRFERIRGVRTP